MLNIYALEQQLQEAMHQHHVPGCALAFAIDASLHYAHGFGVTSTAGYGVPVQADTRFRIGSITKPMTATLIMLLVEKGKLSLDAPITAYLPDFSFHANPAYTEQITLRALLSHTSGLPSAYNPYGYRGEDALRRHVYDEIAHLPFITPPNTVYSYCNPGLRLAGYIAQVVTETPYLQLMQRHLFDPLQMQHTTYDPTVAMTYSVAQAHDLQPDGSLKMVHHYSDNSSGYASGGAISSVIDLVKFGIFHLQQAKRFQPMTTPQVSKYMLDGDAYGLGWALDQKGGIQRIYHEGLIATFGAKLLLIPQANLVMAIACNQTFTFWESMDQTLDAITQYMLPQPTKARKAPAPAITDKQYEGDYLGHERGAARLHHQNKRWYLEWNSIDIPLTPHAENILRGEKDKKAVTVGLIPGGNHIMLNGSPCTRVQGFEFKSLRGNLAHYEGVYIGADVVTVQAKHRHLEITSREYNQTCPCMALNQDHLVCDLGTLFFKDDDTLVMNGIYELTRQT